MGKITVFNFVSIDGCYAGPHGEIDWFKAVPPDAEFERYTHEAARGEGTLIWGRITYDMMHSFWPTPEAIKNDPAMAKVVNERPKVVFSKSLTSVEEGPNWRNVSLFREINPDDIQKLRAHGDMTILGSGSIIRQFASLGLIDRFTLITVPIILGKGKSLFDGVSQLNLNLLESRAFKNGLTLQRYEPKR
jgi:dihydrofolate reductase